MGKSTELNFKMFALINSSSLSGRMFPPSPLCGLADHTFIIQMLPPQTQLFHTKRHAPWDKLTEKVLADFQKYLPFLRHNSWGLWKWNWRVSRCSGRKGAPREHIPPTCTLAWSGLCRPHLPELLSVALGWPLLPPCGLLPWAVPWGMLAHVLALLTSKPFIKADVIRKSFWAGDSKILRKNVEPCEERGGMS